MLLNFSLYVLVDVPCFKLPPNQFKNVNKHSNLTASPSRRLLVSKWICEFVKKIKWTATSASSGQSFDLREGPGKTRVHVFSRCTLLEVVRSLKLGMFGFLYSWFVDQPGPKISCTKTFPNLRLLTTPVHDILWWQHYVCKRNISYYSTFFGATVLMREVLDICPYSSLFVVATGKTRNNGNMLSFAQQNFK